MTDHLPLTHVDGVRPNVHAEMRMNPLLIGALAYGAYKLLADERPSKPQRKAKTRKPKVPKHVEHRNVERAVCAKLGKKHLGGSGRADCEGGVEVKGYRRRKVNKHVVRTEARKGRTVIVSPFTGFTAGAKREAARRKVKLSSVTL